MNKLFIILALTIISATTLFAENVPHDSDGGRKPMDEIEPNNVVCDSNKVNITVVYDNNPSKKGLETSWGFSCRITGPEKNILFDTGGDGSLLLKNMSKLGIDPNTIELVVLSHEHWDHIGGMEMLLKKNSKVSVFMPESFPKEFKQKVSFLGAEIIETLPPCQICRGVYSTGQLGTSIKEQGLIIRTDRGLILITGCAHPGIVKMVQRAKEIFNEQILFVMGGFHLNAASKSQIEEIIKAFKDFGVKYAAPCHCTGDNARALFAEKFGEKYVDVGVGRVIAIKSLK